MTKSNQEIIDALEACILDDEEGAGYLFDMMRSGMGDRIKEILSKEGWGEQGIKPEEYFRICAERDKIINDLCTEQRKNSVLEECLRKTQNWLRRAFPQHMYRGSIDDYITEALGDRNPERMPHRRNILTEGNWEA